MVPLVTIITPVYNRADLIRETVESVLSQDYPRVEYIVLDDGSTDDTLKVLQEYKGRIVLESHANIGETKTVNKGFRMAKGEILGVVNSDDPILPGAVSRIAQHFTEHPEVIVVYPDWQKIDGKGRIVEKVRTPEYDYGYMVRTFHCVPGPGTFFRASVAKRLEGRDERFRYVGDFDFWLRAGLLGQFVRIPEVLATFRVHSGSASVRKEGDGISREHIELAYRFFTSSDLPENIQKRRRETFAHAYFLAGLLCNRRMIIKKSMYFVKSFVYSPTILLLRFRNRFLRSIVTRRPITWQ